MLDWLTKKDFATDFAVKAGKPNLSPICAGSTLGEIRLTPGKRILLRNRQTLGDFEEWNRSERASG